MILKTKKIQQLTIKMTLHVKMKCLSNDSDNKENTMDGDDKGIASENGTDRMPNNSNNKYNNADEDNKDNDRN